MKIPYFRDAGQWTKGQVARNSSGEGAFPHAIGAVRWCLVGWLNKKFESSKEWRGARNAVIKIVGEDLVSFNDAPETTFAMIQEVIEKANKILEEG